MVGNPTIGIESQFRGCSPLEYGMPTVSLLQTVQSRQNSIAQLADLMATT